MLLLLAGASGLEGQTPAPEAPRPPLPPPPAYGQMVSLNPFGLLLEFYNFYVGVGVGLKRLLGDTVETPFVPTFRIVNLGFAF